MILPTTKEGKPMSEYNTFTECSINLLDTCQNILDQKGFDNVEAREIIYRASGYRQGIHFEFTSNESDYYSKTIFATDSDDLFLQLLAIPNRERRDLAQLAEKLAGIRDMAETLNSVLAKGIVAEVMDNAKPLFMALEDKR